MKTNQEPTETLDTMPSGYIKVWLDYAPKSNGKKFTEWCTKYGFTPLGSGRRAWCPSLSTYMRGASGIAFNDGEPFLFSEEDVLDAETLITSEAHRMLEEAMPEPEAEVKIPFGKEEVLIASCGYNQALEDIKSNMEKQA